MKHPYLASLITFLLFIHAFIGFSQSNWQKSMISSANTFQHVSCVNDTTLFALTSLGDLYQSTNKGKNWKLKSATTYAAATSLVFTDTSHGYITASTNIYKTIDGGKSWSTISISNTNTTLKMYSNQKGIAYTKYNIFQSTLNGFTTRYSITNPTILDFDICDTATIYGYTFSGSFYKSTDLGKTWKNLASNSYVTDNASCIKTIHKNSFVAGTTYGGLYICTDGLSVNRKTTPLTESINKIVVLDSVTFYIQYSSKKIYKTMDAGNTWTLDRVTKNAISSTSTFKNKAYFVTLNDSLFTYQLAPTTTWNGSSWTNQKPDSSREAIFTANYSTLSNGAIVAKNITIKAGVTLTADLQNGFVADTIFNEGQMMVTAPKAVFNWLVGNKLDQILSFAAFADVKVASSPLKIIASASSLSPIMNYQLVNASGASLIGDEVSFNSLGEITLSAQQPGTPFYNASPIVSRVLNVVADYVTTTELSLGNWYNWNASATVITFDDWSPGQYMTGIVEMTKRKLPSTFYVTKSNMGVVYDATGTAEFTAMKNAVNVGIEIGNHTMSHPHLPLATPTNLTTEVDSTLTWLNRNVTNQKVTTFAYPFGDYNQTVINAVKKNHIGARIIDAPLNGWPYSFAKSKDDYFRINTLEVDSAFGAAGFGVGIRQAIQDGGLITFMIHSINGDVADRWWDAIPAKDFKTMMDTVQTYRDKTWITTFSNAIKYHKEKNCATLTKVSDTDTMLVLSLVDTLSNNNTYNHPLSIAYNYPLGDVFTSVNQNGKALTFESGNGMMRFNAVPDNGPIYLKKSSSHLILKLGQNNASNPLVTLFPNPTLSHTCTVLFNQANSMPIRIEIYDLLGQLIDVHNHVLPQHIITLPRAGMYLVKCSDGHSVQTIKMQAV